MHAKFKLYTYCEQGFDHLKMNVPCQDAFKVDNAGTYMIAAVADGVGSFQRDGERRISRHSDQASKRAVERAVASVKASIMSVLAADRPADARPAPSEESDEAPDLIAPKFLKYAIQEAFCSTRAQQAQDYADQGLAEGEADCTLTLIVWDGVTLAWGQAGDSGAVIALDDGTYLCPTPVHRDDEGRVYPLRFGTTWNFGVVEQPVSAVMLATDGLFERVCPPLLGRVVSDRGYELPRVDTSLAPCFMHHEPGEWEADEEQQAWVERTDRFLSQSPRMKTGDDRTMVLIWLSEHAPALRDEGYYAAPDWRDLNLRAQAKVMACWAQANPSAAGPQGTEQQLYERLRAEELAEQAHAASAVEDPVPPAPDDGPQGAAAPKAPVPAEGVAQDDAPVPAEGDGAPEAPVLETPVPGQEG